MYEEHFNFTSPPFSIAPNPRFIYLSPPHREALAHLLFGISAGGGFVALTGEVGTGKTTLCRCLLEQLPDDVDIALIFNPRLNARELLASICDELHIPQPEHRASIKDLIDRLNHHLLDTHASGRRTVVLIDEAQNLSYDVLEQIRLLTNLETNEFKLLQIILVGQPELRTLLARPNLRQLSQRITARFHLPPLSLPDTQGYIEHRLAVSGARQPIFSRHAVSLVYRLTGGVPRLINLICDRALLGAYALGKVKVTRAIVRKAAREALPEQVPRRTSFALGLLAVGLAVVAILQHLGYFSLSDLWSSRENTQYVVAMTGGGKRSLPTPAITPSPTPSVIPGPSATPPTDQPALLDGPTDMAPSPVAPAQPSGQPAPTPSAMPAGPPEKHFSDIVGNMNASREPAFAQLFALWRVDPPPKGNDACSFVRQHGLRCLDMRMDWQQLQTLNRPALLEFVRSDGTARYAMLRGIVDTQAILDVQGLEFRVDAEELRPFWRGNAVLLWKPPYGKASAGVGDTGDTVRWVRERLQASAPGGADAVFDEKLKARVMNFQTQRGLLPDGRVGPVTMQHLEQLASPVEGPTLSPSRD